MFTRTRNLHVSQDFINTVVSEEVILFADLISQNLTLFLYKINTNILHNFLTATDCPRDSNNAFVHGCVERLISVHSTFSQMICELLAFCMETVGHGMNCWTSTPKNRQ